MKKLTAGIFATILGLTAVDAFAASNVASTKYVQGAIDSLAEVAKTGDYGDLINTPEIPSIEGLATTDYVDQAEVDAVDAAKNYTDQTTSDMATKTWVGEQNYVTSGTLDGKGFATTGYVDQAEADAIKAAADAAVLLYVPLTAVVDSYPDASLNQPQQ